MHQLTEAQWAIVAAFTYKCGATVAFRFSKDCQVSRVEPLYIEVDERTVQPDTSGSAIVNDSAISLKCTLVAKPSTPLSTVDTIDACLRDLQFITDKFELVASTTPYDMVRLTCVKGGTWTIKYVQRRLRFFESCLHKCSFRVLTNADGVTYLQCA